MGFLPTCLHYIGIVPHCQGIYLTDKGKAFCKKKILPVREAEDKAFSSLTEEERNALVEITKKHILFLKENREKSTKHQ